MAGYEAYIGPNSFAFPDPSAPTEVKMFNNFTYAVFVSEDIRDNRIGPYVVKDPTCLKNCPLYKHCLNQAETIPEYYAQPIVFSETVYGAECAALLNQTFDNSGVLRRVLEEMVFLDCLLTATG